MTTKFVVTDEQNWTFLKRLVLFEQRWLDGKLDPEIVLPGLQALMEGKQIIISEKSASVDWLSSILICERRYHLTFFGQEFDLTEFEQKLRFYGRKRIKAWQNLGLEPHYLPLVSMMLDDDYPGWKIKLGQWFYQKLIEGKLCRYIDSQMIKATEAKLGGISVLIDARLKPAFDDGRQMYEKDNLLGPIIARLRKEGKIAHYDYGSQYSRFDISADEWEAAIKPALAGKLGLDAKQVRLETVEEGNIIPQIYLDLSRKDDGKTDTWVWYEQYLGDDCDLRLDGGDSTCGGLSSVDDNSSDSHWRYRSVRPLVVL